VVNVRSSPPPPAADDTMSAVRLTASLPASWLGGGSQPAVRRTVRISAGQKTNIAAANPSCLSVTSPTTRPAITGIPNSSTYTGCPSSASWQYSQLDSGGVPPRPVPSSEEVSTSGPSPVPVSIPPSPGPAPSPSPGSTDEVSVAAAIPTASTQRRARAMILRCFLMRGRLSAWESPFQDIKADVVSWDPVPRFCREFLFERSSFSSEALSETG
jgi:hypothetical protein